MQHRKVIFVTDPKIKVKPAVSAAGSFEALAKNLDTVARGIDRHKACTFDKAAGLPGLGAHEISKLETLRNHADSRAQQHTRG